jgi:capsular exopolysaccharide synthesis family protein
MQRMKSYTQLSNSNQVMQPVLDRLHLGLSVAQLSSKISVTNPPDTVVLVVAATDTNAQRAAAIANGAADSVSRTIEQLEQTDSQAPGAKIVATVTKRASVPTSPSSPRRNLDAALGLVIGLALGLLVAIYRQQTRARIERPRDVQAATDAVPLSVIPRRDTKRLTFAGKRPADATFGRLYERLAVAAGGRLPHLVLVTSPVAKVGRSAVACNLAAAAARAGMRVLLIDADLHSAGATALLGMEPVDGLKQVLGGAPLDEIVRHSDAGGFDVVPGLVESNGAWLVTASSLRDRLAQLHDRYDLVLVDTAPLEDAADAFLLARSADAVLTVVRRSRTTVEQLSRTVEVLSTIDAPFLGTVLTYGRRRDARVSAYVTRPAGARPAPVVATDESDATQPTAITPDHNGFRRDRRRRTNRDDALVLSEVRAPQPVEQRAGN